MTAFRQTTIVQIMDQSDSIGGTRTDLVRLPRGADSSLFGGWGIRI